MNEFFSNIRTFFASLSLGQRFGLIGVLLGGVISLLALAYWTQQPDYVLLFGDLSSGEANQIVQTLQQENVSYNLGDSGSTIYVPRERVHELRLRFAGEGVVSDGTTGYELFDSNTLGMTDFMQQMNKKRALEGELGRTISSLEQLENGRVHLVMPERSPFRETQNPPTASVIVTLQGNRQLDRSQVRGIVSLVAGAVEGLQPDNVSILDTEGNMLSDPAEGNENLELTNAQLRMQQQFENHLVDKGQSMLDEVLGAGNSILRVGAELDFSRSIAESETIDPESQTIISEERLQESTDGADANSMVRNYELSRSTTRTEENVGRLSYLTVSVMLNQRTAPAPDGDGEEAEDADQVAEPYTQEELDEIESLIKNAVGFKPDRGDQFAIQQTRFEPGSGNTIAEEIRQQRQNERMRLYLRYGLMLLAIVAAIWLIRSTSKRVSQGEWTVGQLGPGDASRQLPGETGGNSAVPSELVEDEEKDVEDLVLVDDIYTSKLSAEAKAKLKAKHREFEEIRDQVQTDPDAAANLIHTWMVEDTVQA
jgi:flagellar M-ring protein FliF